MSSKFGSILNASDLKERSFSFGDSGEFEGSIFDFKSSLPNVSYAASTGGPHTLSTPKPSKPQNYPLGTTSISGGIASRHPPQESFLHKFAAVADATREIELTSTLSTVSLDGSNSCRRTSFGSDAASVKPFNISPHGSMNENLNISSRNSRHQSISEKIDNYNSNSPIQATATLSGPHDSASASASGAFNDNSQGHNPGFWNPATATSFTPHQSHNYFLDAGSIPPPSMQYIPQSSYSRGTPFYPPISPPPFMMNSPQYVDGGIYGMIPYPLTPAPQDPNSAESFEDKKDAAVELEKKLQQPKTGALPGVGLMNRSVQPHPTGFMFQSFVPFSMYPAQASNAPATEAPSNTQSPVAKVQNSGTGLTPPRNQSNHNSRVGTMNGQGKKYKNGKGAAGGGKASHHIYRSPLLEEVRSNAKGKDYHLKDIYGHIVEFTKDQHGSRFIQQKLPTASEEEKEVVFNELRDIALELMTDVFGNYVIQKYFEYGSMTQKQILLESMSGEVYNLSLQMYGCRVVQRALEYAPLDGQRSIVDELKNHILVCAKDQNGNHVVQKSIEKIPIEHVGFILDSLRNHIYHLSTHPYGCRVIQRLLEHSSPADQHFILTDLKRFIFYLIQDQYGNYVIQHILENGDTDDQEEILKIALGSIVNFSKHKFASNVIEKCIKNGSLDQKRRIHAEVMAGNEDLNKEHVDDDSPLAFMMKDQYANYVIQKLVEGFDAKSPEKKMLVVKLRQYLKQLSMKNNYGKHLASVEKMIAVAETALVEEEA